MRSAVSAFMLALSLMSAGEAGGQVLSPKEPFHIAADAVRFRGVNDSTALVELHYAISEAGMTYNLDSSSWKCSAEVMVLVRMKDSVVAGGRWLVPHAIADTAALGPGMTLVGVYDLSLGAGNYTLSVTGRDHNALKRRDSLAFRLPVTPPVASRLTLSDIEFASSIRQGSRQSPFYKNTLEVIPNVGALYGEGQKCSYYLEAYNLLLGNDHSDLTMRTGVLDAVGKELLSRDRTRKRAGESAVLVDQFDAGKLKTGTYTLVVSLLDTSRRMLVQSAKKFFVYNPKLGIDSTLLTASGSLPLMVYASMEEPELDREFNWSKYETTDAERVQYKQLTGVDVKRKFLSDIWRRRPPGTREEYMARAAYANANFGTMGREGYKTDRGRVYIVYGVPDEIQRHPNEADMKPYEVWMYTNIQGGVEFDFVQRNQGGDLELVNSTHRNELHDDNWQKYAQTN